MSLSPARFICIFAVCLALLALPFSHAARAEDHGPIRVVASFSILGDMARQLAGEWIALKTLVGPDTDAHTYQPTPDDVRAVAEANILIVNGLGFEGWMKRMVESSGTHALLLIASAGVAPRRMVDDEGSGEVTDPHAWQNIANGRLYIRNIAAALMQAVPLHATAIRDRAKKLDQELAALDSATRKDIATIPAAERKIITSHDAFGYFGAAYGVTFLAPQGLSTESEPSAANVAKLVQQIKDEHVHEVFVETMTDPRLVEQIAKDSGATMGGALYADALSAPNGNAPTYQAMMRHNVTLLVNAMKGQGAQGQAAQE